MIPSLRLLLLCLVLTAWAPGPAAGEAVDPLRRLAGEELLPSTRTALVAEACGAPVSPEALRVLFESDRRAPPLDATRIAVCRQQEDLIPLMVEEFARAYVGSRATSDPDVFERLLRGLQRFPHEVVRARLAEASYAGIVEAIRDRFVGNQVQNLAPDPTNPPLSTLRPEQQRRLEDAARRWFDGLMSHGPTGLQWLQTDSGGGIAMLEAALQQQLIDELVTHGSPGEKAVGEELLRQLPEPSGDPYPTGATVRPVVPLTVTVPPGVFRHPPPPRPASPAVPLAVGAALLLGLWVLALRRWPASRAALFPVGALVLVGGGLAAVELVLGLVGVRPLAELRPAFDPNQVSGPLYERVVLEGQARLAATQGGHRYGVLEVPKPPGRKRLVALGESSVHGTHYLAEEAFPAVLGARLDGVEVVNAGMGAALSDEILRAGLEALEWDPDGLLLYYGYNDLTHLPYMARFRGYSPRGMRLRRQLGQWRTVRVLRGVLPDRILYAGAVDERAAHLDDEEPSNEDLLSLVELARENATGNMVRLVAAARERGVPVLIVSQASNESGCPPHEAGRAAILAMQCSRDELAGIATQAAARTGTPWFDGAGVVRASIEALPRSEDVDPWNQLFWDGIHPTREGHELLGQALVEPVRELLAE